MCRMPPAAAKPSTEATSSEVAQNVAPLRGEHGSAAASTVFKIQPHLYAGAV